VSFTSHFCSLLRTCSASHLALALLAWALLSWGLGYTVQHAAGPASAGGTVTAWTVAAAERVGAVSARLQVGPPAPSWRAWAKPCSPGSAFGKSLLEDASCSPDLDPEMPEYPMPSTAPAVRIETLKLQPCAPPVAVVIAPPQRLFRPPDLA
jgi:hypothetical protein